jgi:large subunit ribosomal protein L30
MAKTIVVKQIGSPDPPPRNPAPDADRPGPEQDAQEPASWRIHPSVRGMIAKIPHLVEIVEERG